MMDEIEMVFTLKPNDNVLEIKRIKEKLYIQQNGDINLIRERKRTTSIPKEKVREFVLFMNEIMEHCYGKCKDYCKSCVVCETWKEYNKQKKQLLGEK